MNRLQLVLLAGASLALLAGCEQDSRPPFSTHIPPPPTVIVKQPSRPPPTATPHQSSSGRPPLILDLPADPGRQDSADPDSSKGPAASAQADPFAGPAKDRQKLEVSGGVGIDPKSTLQQPRLDSANIQVKSQF